MDVKDLKLEHFEGKEGQGLTVMVGEDDEPNVQLKLVEVTPSPSPFPEGYEGEKPEGIREEPFSLILRGPASEKLPEVILDVEIPEVGTVSISMHAIGEKEDQIEYQAAFN